MLTGLDYASLDQIQNFHIESEADYDELAYYFADEQVPKSETRMPLAVKQFKREIKAAIRSGELRLNRVSTPGGSVFAQYLARKGLVSFCTARDWRPAFLYTEARQEKSAHGNIERNAENREQTMGAAFCLLLTYPDQCRDARSGKVSARKIAELIEDKSALIWPDRKRAWLGVDKMETHIRAWLKKLQ